MRNPPRRMAHRGERGTASLEALLCLPFIFLILALVVDIGYGWLVRLRADVAVRYAGTTYVNLLSEGTRPEAAASQTEETLRRVYYNRGEVFDLEIRSAALVPQEEPDEHAGMVWATPGSKIYHYANDRWYAATSTAVWMTEEDAIAQGYRLAKFGWWSGKPRPGVTDLGTGISDNGGGTLDGSILGKLAALGERVSGRNDLLLTVERRVPIRPLKPLLPDTPVEVPFSLDGNTWTYAEVPLSFDALTDARSKGPTSPIRVFTAIIQGFLWALGMEA